MKGGAIAAAILLAANARAEAAPTASAPVLPTDPVLAELIEQSVAARPELRQAEAELRAERERVPQAGALPDPVLSLGIQNERFGEITVGEMEGSSYQVMLNQGLPWPGKLRLRTDVARLAAEEADAALARARLTTEADVRRAYTDLLLARDRLVLLGVLEDIWEISAGTARARYEAGEGAQSDVLRSQLELNRIRQRRWALEAQERTATQTLNRLRSRPVDEPIATAASLRTTAIPEFRTEEREVADAFARSPELAQARLAHARARTSVSLARRERFPDLGVNLGVMPRGRLDPMWTAGISVGLPIWASRKQGKAVAESRARADAAGLDAETIEQVLRLRVAERRAVYAAALETIAIFRDGLLVQSRATAESTLAQYRVGTVTFASVLEANAGYVADEESFLTSVAEAQRIAIAAAEVTLDPVAFSGAGGAGGAMPGTGAMGGSGMAAGTAAAGAAPASASPGSMTPGM